MIKYPSLLGDPIIGLGKAIAESLAETGVKITIIDFNKKVWIEDRCTYRRKFSSRNLFCS